MKLHGQPESHQAGLPLAYRFSAHAILAESVVKGQNLVGIVIPCDPIASVLVGIGSIPAHAAVSAPARRRNINSPEDLLMVRTLDVLIDERASCEDQRDPATSRSQGASSTPARVPIQNRAAPQNPACAPGRIASTRTQRA